MFIGKEVPSGLINGVNKVFTLANTPSYMDDLWMDGAIYISYTLSGNVLTLVDAPTVSIFADYYTGEPNITTTTDVTYGDIKSEVWNLLGQTPNSVTFSEKRVGQTVNQIIRTILTGRVRSLLNPTQIFRAGEIFFLKDTYTVRFKGGSQLTQNCEVGDVTVYCNTVNLLGSGYVQVGGDILHYTSKTDTQLLGVSGITLEHLESEDVVQLFEMPSNLDKINTVSGIVPGQQLRTVDVPLDNTNTYRTFFQIFRQGSKQLVKLVGIPTDYLVTISYNLTYVDMANDNDICPLPKDFGLTVVANIAAGELSYAKNLPIAQVLLNEGYVHLQEMYQYYTNETNVIKQRISPVPYPRNSGYGYPYSNIPTRR